MQGQSILTSLRVLLVAAAYTGLDLVAADTWFNNQDRENAWAAFVYRYWEGVDTRIGFTGDIGKLDPGTTSDGFKAVVLNRINYFRDVAGIRLVPRFDPELNRKAQAAALVMAANHKLSHDIDASWLGFSADAAEAASRSNLYLGQHGADAIAGYIIDAGYGNDSAGHRRWILDPTVSIMGTGDLIQTMPTTATYQSNVLWVSELKNEFAPTRDPGYVTWPTAGYIPSTITPLRWSCQFQSWNERGFGPIDTSKAAVSVTRAGVPVSITGVNRDFINSDAIVWDLQTEESTRPGDLFWTPPSSRTYHVTISGHTARGVPQPAIEYDVKVFNPAEEPPVPSGLTVPPVLEAGAGASFGAIANRRVVVYALSTDGYSNNAESAEGVTTTVVRKPVLSTEQKVSGATSFCLPVTQDTPQTVVLRDRFFPDASSKIIWKYRYESRNWPIEKLHLQINRFDGAGWTSVWSENNPSLTAFQEGTFLLAPYAGQEISIRFLTLAPSPYSADVDDVRVPPTWFIDDIAVTGRRLIEVASIPVDPVNGATWTPSAPGVYRVAMGSRYFDKWDGPAGASTEVIVRGAGGPSYFDNISIRSSAGKDSETLIMGFVVRGGTKSLLARGIGPTLIDYGVPEAVKDPMLGVYRGDTMISSNDNWGTVESNPGLVETSKRVGAFALTNGSKDAVLHTAVGDGNYTAQIVGMGGTTGVALAELYDAESSGAARLVNFSARSQVGTGAGILIAGFNVSGNSPKKLLIRGIGPTLGGYGVAGVLSRPRLKLYSGQTVLYTNEKWGSAAANPDIIAAAKSVGAFDLQDNSSDAAILVTLMPGSYTATIEGVNEQTGVALVEVYDVP